MNRWYRQSVLSVLCICVGINATGAVTVADFRVANQMADWTESTFQGYATFNDSTSLQALIDGGYILYTSNGVIEGIQQNLEEDVAYTGCRAMIMDFGTSAKASVFFTIAKHTSTVFPTSYPLPDYADSVAVKRPVLGGVFVAAHFQNFYFEISMSGYTDSIQAVTDAKLFLAYYANLARLTSVRPTAETKSNSGGLVALYIDGKRSMTASVRYGASSSVSRQVPVGIFHANGELVIRLVATRGRGGQVDAFWDGRNMAGACVGPGSYLLRVLSGVGPQSTVFVLLK
jgi:hypothetical protein